MRFIAVIFALLLSCSAQAQVPMTGAGRGAPGGGGGGGCAQATTFLARTSGLSGTESAAATTMICGLVADGVITGTLSGANGCGSYLDGLYILATNTTTTAALNVCGTAFSLTPSGSNVTFTADIGYVSSGDILDTAYTPSTAALNMTQNSAFFLAYDQTASSTGQPVIGAANSAYTNVIQFDFSGTTPEAAINDGKNSYSSAAGTSKGCWLVNRTGASAGFIRRNAAALDTISATSTGLPNVTIYLLGLNQGGSIAAHATDQMSAFAFGGGATPLSTTLADALCNRINTYMAALGHNVY